MLCSLTVSTESDEILFKIDHDLDMIDKHIVNFPKYDHLNWKYFFLCNDPVSVASIKRNNENIMICGFFIYKQSKFEIILKSKFEKIDFDWISVGSLIQLTVVLYWGGMCLVEWIFVHSELMWTIPLGDRTIGESFKEF